MTPDRVELNCTEKLSPGEKAKLNGFMQWLATTGASLQSSPDMFRDQVRRQIDGLPAAVQTAALAMMLKTHAPNVQRAKKMNPALAAAFGRFEKSLQDQLKAATEGNISDFQSLNLDWGLLNGNARTVFQARMDPLQQKSFEARQALEREITKQPSDVQVSLRMHATGQVSATVETMMRISRALQALGREHDENAKEIRKELEIMGAQQGLVVMLLALTPETLGASAGGALFVEGGALTRFAGVVATKMPQLFNLLSKSGKVAFTGAKAFAQNARTAGISVGMGALALTTAEAIGDTAIFGDNGLCALAAAHQRNNMAGRMIEAGIMVGGTSALLATAPLLGIPAAALMVYNTINGLSIEGTRRGQEIQELVHKAEHEAPSNPELARQHMREAVHKLYGAVETTTEDTLAATNMAHAAAGAAVKTTKLLTSAQKNDAPNPRQPFSLKKAALEVFERILPAQNRAYIRTILDPNSKAKMFFTTENVVLKQLNDSVTKDKSIVDRLNNIYKNFLLSEVENEPALKNAILALYSDYKSVRFALKSNDPIIMEALQKAHRRAAQTFADHLRADPEMMKVVAQALKKGLKVSPENWFQGGIGAKHNQANTAARLGRSEADGAPMGLIHFDDLRKEADSFRAQAENLRKDIQNKMDDVKNLLIPVAPGSADKVVSEQAIDYLRKAGTKGWTDDELAKTLNGVFHSKLTAEDAALLKKYAGIVDKFSPAVLQEKRTQMPLDQATHGIVSVDFAGQGARNTHESMKALHETRNVDIEQALAAVDRGDIRSTAIMKERQKLFDEAMSLKGVYSGDDGLAFPDASHPLASTNPIVQKLARRDALQKLSLGTKAGGSFRVTSIPQTYANSNKAIPVQSSKGVTGRAEMIANAEAVEKDFRIRVYMKLAEMASSSDPRDQARSKQMASEMSKLAVWIDAVPTFTGKKSSVTHDLLTPTGTNKNFDDFLQTVFAEVRNDKTEGWRKWLGPNGQILSDMVTIRLQNLQKTPNIQALRTLEGAIKR